MHFYPISILVTFTLAHVSCEHFKVYINLQKPIYEVDDAFVSFAFGTSDMMAMQDNSTRDTLISMALDPAFIKFTDVLDEPSEMISSTHWLNSVGLTPIWSLPYTTDWSNREAIHLLGSVLQSGQTNCVWQLGTELNVSDPITYLDDLEALREISDALNIGQKWNVIGADISAFNTPDEAQFYVELSQHMVDAIGWTRSSASSGIVDKPALGEDPTTINALKTSTRPVWMNFRHHESSAEEVHANLSHKQDQWNALNWALTLGTSALQGFSVVFKPSTASEMIRPSFEMLLSFLFKYLMGNKVFETRLKGNATDVNLYAHCSRNISGAFALMGVNSSPDKHTVGSSLPVGTTGSSVQQYILTIDQNGVVMLNDNPLNGSNINELHLQTKKKRPLSRFFLPAKSIVFYVFPEANVNECHHQHTTEKYVSRPKTASQRLLQEILLDSVSHDRIKRDLDDRPPRNQSDGINRLFFEPMKKELVSKMLGIVKELHKMSTKTHFTSDKNTKEVQENDGNFLLKDQNPPLDNKPTYEDRRKCKILALNLEQQCLLERNPLSPPPNFLHTMRSARVRSRRSAQWNGADDIQTNAIPKQETDYPGIALQPAVSVLSTMYWQDAYGNVHEVPVQITGAENNQETVQRKSQEDMVEASSNSSDYHSPKFMRSFSKSVVSLLDIVNRNVAAWWTAMS